MERRLVKDLKMRKNYLADHPDIFEEIDHKVRVHYGLIEPDEEDIC